MSLMDDWQNGTLKEGWYFVRYDNKVYPDCYRGYFIQTGDRHNLEVLAPCDYDHFVEPTEKVNRSGENSARFEMALYDANREIKQLRALLKECVPYINDCIDVQMSVGHYPELEYDLLTRINAAIGESEE